MMLMKSVHDFQYTEFGFFVENSRKFITNKFLVLRRSTKTNGILPSPTCFHLRGQRSPLLVFSSAFCPHRRINPALHVFSLLEHALALSSSLTWLLLPRWWSSSSFILSSPVPFVTEKKMSRLRLMVKDASDIPAWRQNEAASLEVIWTLKMLTESTNPLVSMKKYHCLWKL